jgi:hypothetical protein
MRVRMQEEGEEVVLGLLRVGGGGGGGGGRRRIGDILLGGTCLTGGDDWERLAGCGYLDDAGDETKRNVIRVHRCWVGYISFPEGDRS